MYCILFFAYLLCNVCLRSIIILPLVFCLGTADRELQALVNTNISNINFLLSFVSPESHFFNQRINFLSFSIQLCSLDIFTSNYLLYCTTKVLFSHMLFSSTFSSPGLAFLLTHLGQLTDNMWRTLEQRWLHATMCASWLIIVRQFTGENVFKCRLYFQLPHNWYD